MIFYNLLIQIWLLFNFITTVFCLYQIVIAVAGLHKNKKPVRCDKKRRFAAIIAARNEEAVIANLIDSLHKQNYPKDLLDIIVVADNCTDNTAKIAKAAGAIVYERFNKVKIGKGFVLQYIFEKLLNERDIYDAFCIFDADNVVDKEFFNQMNDMIEAGYDVAQGYRDMKNASDTWVSGTHAIFYWMENRFFNSARSCLGLSATINGTGFMITSKFIKEIGYNTHTCTEDIEFSIQTVLAGKSVGWAPFAKVYDEQPTTLSQSMRQRLRWTNGLIQCFWRYIGPLAKKIIDNPDWVSIDLFMYLLSFPTIIFCLLSSVMSGLFVVFRIFDPMGSLLNFLLLAIGMFVGCWFTGLLTLITEKKLSKDMFTSVASFPIFNILWVPIYIMCIFKKKVDWKPIVHVRNISISDIESNSKA